MGSKKLVTCIDIGTDSIKFLSGGWSSEQVELHQMAVFPYQPGSFQKYGLDVQLDTLKEVLLKQKIKDPVVVSLSDPSTALQQISFPNMPDNELRSAIQWELTQKKKLDPNKTAYDFIQVTPAYEDASNKIVLITTKNKNDISKLLALFAAQKIKVLAVETPVFALIQGIKNQQKFPSSRAYLILNLGASTCINIAHNGQLVFERKLNTGGESLTKAIVEYCKLDWESAEKIKTEHGISSSVLSDKIIEARHILTSSLEKLVSEIQYTIKYFFYQVTKSKITAFEKLILTGGGAYLPGLLDFMKERLGMDCVLADFSERTVLPKGIVFPEDKSFSPLFATALGLGYWNEENLTAGCSSFIERHEKEKPKSAVQKIIAGFFSAVVVITFIIGVAFFLTVYMKKLDSMVIGPLEKHNRESTEVISNLEKQEALSKTRIVEIESLKKEKESLLKDLRRKMDSIRSYHPLEESLGDQFRIISEEVPAGLFAFQIEVNEPDLVMSGIAPSNEVIAEFMKNLNGSGKFRNCNFLYTRKTEENKDLKGTEFELRAEA
ncbi:MAG: pilus assembly protein PilM [Candidatus Aureabacteria bacterium]|nr:pilus assembly protein PilM [Candidatus Auribacterota bacterium]